MKQWIANRVPEECVRPNIQSFSELLYGPILTRSLSPYRGYMSTVRQEDATSVSCFVLVLAPPMFDPSIIDFACAWSCEKDVRNFAFDVGKKVAPIGYFVDPEDVRDPTIVSQRIQQCNPGYAFPLLFLCTS